MNNYTPVYLTKVSILAAVASIFMLFEFPSPFIPDFLKMDISEIPALLGAFSIGPFAGILISLIKNILHLFVTRTLGIGEMANFAIGAALIVPAGIIYQKYKSRKGAAIALLVGTASMTIMAAVLNYYILLPLYERIFKISLLQIVSMAGRVNPYIIDVKSLIVFGIVPFNVVKSLIISLVTMLIYKKISFFLHK